MSAANRLRPLDRVIVSTVANVVDVAVAILRGIDMRHYYGREKQPTKRAVYDLDLDLQALAQRLCELVEESEKRDTLRLL